MILKKLAVVLTLVILSWTVAFSQTFTAPASISFTHMGSNTAYTSRYVLVNTNTNLIAYSATSTNFTSVVAGSYTLYGVNYDPSGTAPTLTVGTNFSTIGGSCVALSSSLPVSVTDSGTTCASMYTLKSGSWNDTSVWSCGRLPTLSDVVTIRDGHVIVLNVDGSVKGIVYQGGTLRLSENTRLVING